MPVRRQLQPLCFVVQHHNCLAFPGVSWLHLPESQGLVLICCGDPVSGKFGDSNHLASFVELDAFKIRVGEVGVVEDGVVKVGVPQ